MRTIAVLLTAALLTAAPAAVVVQSTQARPDQAQSASTAKVCTLKVSGMTCDGCAAAVKRAAKKVGGVKAADVSYEKGRAVVTYDPTKTSPEAIAKAVTEKSGFKAEVLKSDKK